VKWISHIGKYNTLGRTLLIFYGAEIHLQTIIVDIAEKNSVALYAPV
jgi:hypothetical protein